MKYMLLATCCFYALSTFTGDRNLNNTAIVFGANHVAQTNRAEKRTILQGSRNNDGQRFIGQSKGSKGSHKSKNAIKKRGRGK